MGLPCKVLRGEYLRSRSRSPHSIQYYFDHSRTRPLSERQSRYCSSRSEVPKEPVKVSTGGVCTKGVGIVGVN